MSSALVGLLLLVRLRVVLLVRVALVVVAMSVLVTVLVAAFAVLVQVGGPRGDGQLQRVFDGGCGCGR